MVVESKNSSKQIILKTAKDLFWKHGIRRITVEEICKEAGISKMTFYRNFKNKLEVAEKVIIQIYSSSFSRYRAIMKQEVTFQIKVRKLVQLKYEEVTGISKEFVKDIYQIKDSSLRKILDEYSQKMLVEMMNDFAEAQKKGEIRKDLKLDFILYLINDMNRKIMDEKLNKMYKNEEDLIMELTNYFFYGILSK